MISMIEKKRVKNQFWWGCDVKYFSNLKNKLIFDGNQPILRMIGCV